jgi:hypothetical protein
MAQKRAETRGAQHGLTLSVKHSHRGLMQHGFKNSGKLGLRSWHTGTLPDPQYSDRKQFITQNYRSLAIRVEL